MDSPISEKLGSTSGTISTASRLLKLPAELRIIILRYLLPSATRQFKVYTDYDLIYTDKKWSCHSKHRHHERISPSLSILRTNRLIYYEALSILYGENAFHFIGSNFLPILDFIRRLSPEAQSLVRRIKITMLPDGRNPRAGQLEEFCRIVHYILPGLNKFDSDSWIWF
ncbi:hypothetical protein EJ06DRAFT_477844 [Trichodelitschia bisporula]|uniref:DUF7730 domain-containing protein n=1 Tax=Trichodelitschia bisporula TaxID=703511 RepID=A0A6G1HV66_9PEZI|nr:hypothetical protein EJ06DRAFT_477844 [Trichodelitschia bisporula]